MQVVPLVPMLGSEFKGMECVSLQKVPTNVKAVRSLSGLLRGFMSKELESKTDFHGYAHLDDVKRELLTGRFHKEVSRWSVETFMSIAAFDEKDRFELLTALTSSTVHLCKNGAFQDPLCPGASGRIFKEKESDNWCIKSFLC